MAIDRERARQCLKHFDFRKLFIEELGWDRFSRTIVKEIEGLEYRFHGVAEKRGVAVLVADSIPEYAIRVKLDKLIAKDHFEHLIVFTDQARGRQKWQWVRKESGKPTAVRNYDYSASGHAGELLLQKLDSLVFTLDEEEAGIHTGTVTGRLRTFDVEKVTKKFYERFKTEHSGFLGFIKGIPDKQMESWYASVMINRLMFLYFIQEKSFLNGDKDYLRNKLAESGDRKRDVYYADFLCPLFFQGFARKKAERSTATNKLLDEIPYLNGGLFQKHQIEELHGKTIHIADAAFEKLFEFFKEYNWHLDERENRDDREINPDVLGYIFEKYINQKQMGAYYTKEDITEYISQNTIIPYLLDEARKGCAIAFAPEGSVWRLLRDHPDRYIHDAMKWGADETLPNEIEAGVHDVAQRAGWNRTAPEEFALPTEIWREAIDRHQRYRAVKAKLASGEVHEVNDLVPLNLNIRQFAQDVIQFSEGPELLRAIWKAIEKVSILDPTCGSGAFLFAALNILKPLYDACIQRMEGFVEDLEAAGKHDPRKFKDFRDTLLKSKEHPKPDYFVLKAIIVNNLFGVDIMEEAVEICKLRLFLKLVAQVESQDRIEPLPDIDFNIRAGNTLVGYAALKDIGPTRGIRTDEENEMLGAIEDKALLLDAKVRSFRLQQTELDGTVTPDDKAVLRTQFNELDRELNYAAELQRYLQASFYDGEGFWHLLLHPVLWGVAFILALLALRIWLHDQSKQEERHGRRTKGPELLSALRWNRQTKADGIQLRLRWDNPWLDRFGKLLPGWASPSFRVPRNLEASHILLMGDTGSGKSSAIRQILRQIAERGETAIVYDPALEFTPEFYSPARGDLILNPLDTRCPYWGLGDEITRDETAMTIAAAFLPEKEYEKEFFTDGPRRILAHLLKWKPQPRDILRMMSNPSNIEAAIKGTPLAPLLDSAAPAQRAGVLSSLNMVADSLELLPEWEHTRPTFATAEWYDERKRWVFLTSQSSYREKILPLHSVWLDLFILRMMGYCDAPNVKPVWFVLDELASLNKLPQLHTAVTENRKYGNPVVMGFQGRSQLEKRYGQDAEAMLSQPATKIFFKTSEPRAAKWISEAIGEIEVERLKESRSMGLLRSKKSFAMEIATKPLVMPSEIAGLEPLHGYIKQGNRVVPAHLPYLKLKAKQLGFIERKMPVLVPRPAPPVVPIETSKTPASNPSAVAKKPAKKQAVLAPFSKQRTVNEEAPDWDESQWIE